MRHEQTVPTIWVYVKEYATKAMSRRSSILLLGTLLAIVAVVICIFSARGSPKAGESSDQQKVQAGIQGEQFTNLSADKLYAKASAAVVRVVVRNRDFRVTGLGSGFVVTPDGLIVTNYHVVADAYFADVQFPNGGSYLVEGLSGLDSDADLAILKINATKLPALEIAEEVLPPIGTQVFAIGNPRGLTNTLSEGLVSGHRTTKGGLAQIQTTAAISPGSSGGPLLNSAAQVVGVTTQCLEEGQNLNFVVPVARVSRLLHQHGTIKTLASSNIGRLSETDASTLEQVWDAIHSANYGRALTLLAELRAGQGDSSYYWDAVGRVHLDLGNNELAVEAYKTAIQIAPHEPAIYFNLGLAYARSGRSEEAVSAYCSAVDLDPNDPKTLYALGVKLGTMGRNQESIVVLRRANQFASEKAEKAKILSSLGMVYSLADQLVEAVQSLESAIACGARDADTLYFLGVSYKCLGRYSEAEMALRSALDIDPNHDLAGRDLKEISVRSKRNGDTIAAPAPVRHPETTRWYSSQKRTAHRTSDYQETIQSQKRRHEQLMDQARKDRRAEEERWHKEWEAEKDRRSKERIEKWKAAQHYGW